MVSSGTIDRIAAPAPLEFRRQYVAEQRPVVVTDLFNGEPIRELMTAAAACDVLGDMRLKTRPNYLNALFGNHAGSRGSADEVREETLSEYVGSAQQPGGCDRLCVEFRTPDVLRSLFRTPSLADGDSQDLLSLLFVAGARNVAHMHFDTDHRQVFLYQVFGRKRVIIVSPRQAKKLMPISGTSLLTLAQWPEEEKQRFCRYVDAYDTVLEPGEAIFIPALAWHYVEYVDLAMSFSIRFGRNAYGRYLADNVFPDMFVQNVGCKYLGDTHDSTISQRFNHIKEVVERDYPDAAARHGAVSACFKQLYSELCVDSIQHPYCAGPFERAELGLALQYYSQRERRVAGTATADQWRS